jgi:glutamyl/glutaminyl-tRNA synthetase
MAREKIMTLHMKILEDSIVKLQAISEWNRENIKDALDSIAISNEVSYKEVANALRFALTGSSVGISIDKFVHVFGLSSTNERLVQFMKQ